MRNILAISLLLLLQAVPPQTSSIEGTVLDTTTGAPVTGVALSVNCWKERDRFLGCFTPQLGGSFIPFGYSTEDVSSGRIERNSPAESGQSGAFTLGNVGGRVTVRFDKQGYRPQSLTVSARPGERVKIPPVRLSRTPSGVVAGRVIDSKGQPVVLASVIAYQFRMSGDERQLVSWAPYGRTNDRGEFRLTDLPSGRYMVGVAPSAQQPWGMPASAEAPRIGASFYPGVGDLSRAGSIDVRNGEETRLSDFVAGVARMGMLRIHLANESGADISNLAFQIGYVTSDVTTGSSYGLGGANAPERVDLAVGARTLKSYWPNRPGIFEVHLHWRETDGIPIDTTQLFEYTGTEADWNVVIAKPAASLQIRVQIEQDDGTLRAAPPSTVTLCRPGPASICTFFPLQRYEWTNEDWAKGRVGNSRPRPIATAADGTVKLDSLPNGRYELFSVALADGFFLNSARQGEHDALSEGVIVNGSASTLDIRIRPHGGILQGKVETAEGRLLSNALVALRPTSPLDKSRLQALRRSVRTDQNGIFEVTGMTPGDYRVSVQRSDDDPPGNPEDSEVTVHIAENARAAISLKAPH